MAFRIEESFDVEAPIDHVWAFLVDPRRVVVCLPGADVTDVVDDQTYKGRVSVKVGPVTARYAGTVRLEEADEVERVVRLRGEGKETGGTGSARMTMQGQLSEVDAQTTRVRFEAEIDVAGRMARFGRGVMEDVSRELFREFATNTQEHLDQSVEHPVGTEQDHEASAPQGGRTAGEAPSGPVTGQHVGRTAGEAERGPAIGEERGRIEGETERGPTAPQKGGSTAVERDATAEIQQSKPVNVPSLVLRAIWSRLKRLVGR